MKKSDDEREAVKRAYKNKPPPNKNVSRIVKFKWKLSLQGIEKGVYRGIVDAEKFIGGSHHAHFIRLARRALFDHELVDRFVGWRTCQDRSHNKKQGSA